MLQMLGCSEADMLGRQLERFMFDEDLAALPQPDGQKRNQGQSSPGTTLPAQGWGECWCLVSATALHDHQGPLHRLFAMFSDITAINRQSNLRARSLVAQIF